MSDKPSVSVPSVPLVVPSDVIVEINEVLGRMNLTKKISDRVSQSPRWKCAAQHITFKIE